MECVTERVACEDIGRPWSWIHEEGRVAREAVDDSWIGRKAVEDPWSWVYKNFYGLAVYYADIFAKSTRRHECFEDFRNEMLYWMVEVAVKYAHLPRVQIVKIIKTVPRNYFGSRLMVKEYQAPRVDVEWIKEGAGAVVVDDAERLEMLYDRYYDRFVDEFYRLGRECPNSPEREILYELLFPSEDFQCFLQERKKIGGVSKTVLRDYFRMKKKWTRGYFEEVFRGIKLELEGRDE